MLKKYDVVVMHSCDEAEYYEGKLWVCKTDEFTRGEGIYKENLVFLKGFSGSFSTKYLQKVGVSKGGGKVKVIFEKWWKNSTKCFSIINYKKAWKEVGNPPLFRFRTNGAKKKNGDTCLDVHLEIGYTVFNYTNFELQKR